MAPYVLLILIPALFCFVTIRRNSFGGRVLCLGLSDTKREGNKAIPVFFLLLLIMLMVRHESIGRDLMNYKSIFNGYASARPGGFLAFEPEVLFGFLNWAIGQITRNYQWYLAVVAVLTIIPMAAIYSEDRRHSYLKISLFVNMTTFIVLFSGIRQALAMAVGMIAYVFVREKKPFWFLIMCLVAVGIHHSGFMILFMYPLYHIRFKKKHLWFVVPAILLIAVFKQQIFSAAVGLLANYMSEYETIMEDTGAYGSLILFALFAIFSYVIPEEAEIDKETLGLRNFLVFSVVLQCFAPVHALAMRMNYYYILFIPITLPKIIDAARMRYKQIAWLAEIVLCVFFTLSFLLTTYKSAQTGISTLDTVPYIPFWRG